MKIQAQTLVSIPIGEHEYHLLDVQLPEGIPLFRDEDGRICVLSRACSVLVGYKQKDTLYRLVLQREASFPKDQLLYRTEDAKPLGEALQQFSPQFPVLTRLLWRVKTAMFLYSPGLSALGLYAQESLDDITTAVWEAERDLSSSDEEDKSEEVLDDDENFLQDIVHLWNGETEEDEEAEEVQEEAPPKEPETTPAWFRRCPSCGALVDPRPRGQAIFARCPECGWTFRGPKTAQVQTVTADALVETVSDFVEEVQKPLLTISKNTWCPGVWSARFSGRLQCWETLYATSSIDAAQSFARQYAPGEGNFAVEVQSPEGRYGVFRVETKLAVIAQAYPLIPEGLMPQDEDQPSEPPQYIEQGD